MKSLNRIIEALRSTLVKRVGLVRVLALVGGALLVTAVTPSPAAACGVTDILSCVALIFIKIFQLLTALMGWILVLEVDALIRVAQYHNFVSPGPSAVQIGWVVTRDLANMFFIVVLLIIAFGTILGSSTYHYEKNLPRLLIMAVVINFSKTICGIFIDMGQVVMLTFVNGFKEAAAGNFVNAFQISKLLALADGQNSYDFGLAVAMMFAFILAAIAVNVVLVMLVTMIFRIVMLWVLIILSPIAFLSSAIPKGGDHYAEWWKEFKKYIISGPIIAFFLWLALASVQHAGTDGLASQGFPGSSTVASGEQSAAGSVGGSQIPSEAGRTEVIMNLVIAICLMFAGLKFANASGMVGLGVAKSIRDRATKLARGVAVAGGSAVGKRLGGPVMGVAGRALAKVPLVGGLGRAMALKNEAWKNERKAKMEKFSGTPEDMARLSPSAFARKTKGLKDPKEIDRYMKAAGTNPAAMAALTATKESYNPLTGERTKSSAGKDVIMNMIKSGDAAGAAKLISDDKRFGNMVKEDPDLLKSVYGGLKDAAVKDPNLGKNVGAFEQKFVAALYKGKKGNGDPNDPSSTPDENFFSNVPEEANKKLAELAPKMSLEDIAGLDSGTVEALLPFMKGGQMKKIMSDGKGDQMGGVTAALAKMDSTAISKLFAENGIGAGDVSSSLYGNANVADYVLDKSKGDAKTRSEVMSKGGKALSARADQRYREATTDEQKLATMPDAISVGTIDATELIGNPATQALIRDNANRIDLAALGRNIAVTDTRRSDAARALATVVSDVDPAKINNLRRSGMSEHILPSSAQMQVKATQAREAKAAEATQAREAKAAEATQSRATQIASLGAEAPQALGSLIEQHKAMRGAVGAEPSPAAAAEMKRLEDSIKSLQTSFTQQKEALKDLTELRDRIGRVNSGAETMKPEQFEGLKKAAENFERQLDQLDTAIAKTVASTKGIELNPGKPQRRGGP